MPGAVKMEWRLRYVALFAACVCGVLGAKSPPDNRVETLELSTVTREVDLTSPLVKQKVTMVVENKGTKAVTAVLYTVEPRLVQRLGYISAQVRPLWVGHTPCSRYNACADSSCKL
jgi:hypothetical protein